MLQRHKIPTIFNIYMLDVICCALGCVVLLWQVSHQEAEEQTASAKEQGSAAVRAREEYEKAQRGLLSASKDVLELQAALADWTRKYQALTQALAMTEKEREEALKLAAAKQLSLDKANSDLTLTKDQLKKLEIDLAKLLADNKKTNAELTGKVKINVELLAKIALADKQIASLKDDIKTKQADLDSASKKSQEQLVSLKLSEEETRKLKKLLDSLRDDNKEAQTKIKVTELQLKVRDQDLDRARKELVELLTAKDKMAKELRLSAKDLADVKSLLALLTAERNQWKDKQLANDKDLASALAALGSLKLDKEKLNQRIVALQAEVEQRFAGIPLTGENVVFLIDISGSMTMKDENTEDPEKWPFLCESLMKLMKSIGTMKRFQVILFSDKTTHLFGNRDSWLKYEGPQTAKQTRDALLKVKVEGGTNMNDGFDEAFRYRKLQLDTIYLFSDGLPNLGPGLPASITKPTEAQSNYYLGKHVRDKLKNDWNRSIKGAPDVRINAVGFFFESPDVGAFLWAMAREHRGAFVGLR